MDMGDNIKIGEEMRLSGVGHLPVRAIVGQLWAQ
jgi:hypothetical protein